MNDNLTVDTGSIKDEDISKYKVVVGMTGKVDSLIAAFLLQKQGYQCIGVGIMTWNIAKYNFSLDGACSVNDLETVKKFCDRLNIPFYAVDAQKEFQEKIINQNVANRLCGNSSFMCHDCHQIKMQILYDKMKLLGANFIATGHFAKCYKNHSTNFFSVHSSMDKEFDQSHLLAGTSQEILRKLLLPLAELHKPEIIKLANKFNLLGLSKVSEGEKLAITECMTDQAEFSAYILENVVEDFRPKGQVLEFITEVPLKEHQGIFNYKIGDQESDIKQGSSKDDAVLRAVVKIDSAINAVYMGNIKNVNYDFIQVVNIKMIPEVDRSKVVQVIVKFSEDHVSHHGELRFKNNATAVLTLKEKIRVRPIKELVIFYNKEGTGAKVLGHGDIDFIGDFELIYRGMQSTKRDKDEENENNNEKESEFKF